jgi:hypothetical protein
MVLARHACVIAKAAQRRGGQPEERGCVDVNDEAATRCLSPKLIARRSEVPPVSALVRRYRGPPPLRATSALTHGWLVGRPFEGEKPLERQVS